MKTFLERFIATIETVQKHFEIIEKLENVLDVELQTLCEGPTKILELLEEESGLNWTDKIWEMIYNKDNPQDIYNEVCMLYLEKIELNKQPAEITEKELFVEQLRVELYKSGLWNDNIEHVVDDLSEEKINLCIASQVSPKTLAKMIIGS